MTSVVDDAFEKAATSGIDAALEELQRLYELRCAMRVYGYPTPVLDRDIADQRNYIRSCVASEIDSELAPSIPAGAPLPTPTARREANAFVKQLESGRFG